MKAFLAAISRLITGANGRWVGCQPNKRQRIYFANHTSNLDAMVIWAALPHPVRILTRPAAARDYWIKGPIRRYLAFNIFNAVLIERRKPTVSNNPLTDMIDAMGKTFSLIIFPEGGRQTNGEIAAFKGGLFHLAKNCPEVELVPVLIDNLNRILPKGEFVPVPLLGSVTFGPPIKLGEDEGKTAFLARAQQAVKNLQKL